MCKLGKGSYNSAAASQFSLIALCSHTTQKHVCSFSTTQRLHSLIVTNASYSHHTTAIVPVARDAILYDCAHAHAHVCLATIVPWRSFISSTLICSVRVENVPSVTQAVFTANTIEDKSICQSVVVCSKKGIYTALLYRVYNYLKPLCTYIYLSGFLCHLQCVLTYIASI